MVALASGGGQIMPPVLGAAAFIMAEILGISYLELMKHALLPAVIFFLSVFLMVDFRARRRNLEGIDNVRSTMTIFKEGGYLLAPIFVIIFMLLVLRSSPKLAAFWAIVVAILVSYIKPQTRMTPHKLIRAFEAAAKDSMMLVVICALAGIIIGTISLTGVGFKLSSIIIKVAGNNLLVLLVLAAVSCIILGMGMPTVACYVLLSVLVSPAIVRFGIEPVVAHFFVFYFGILAGITPPVASSAFAAAAIAKSDPIQTAVEACKLGLIAFLLPFAFVYNPGVLLIGSPITVISAVMTTVLGTVALAVALEGYFMSKISQFERVLLFGAALLLISPSNLWGLIGGAVFGIIALRNYMAAKTVSRNQEVASN